MYVGLSSPYSTSIAKVQPHPNDPGTLLAGHERDGYGDGIRVTDKTIDV